MKVNRLARNRLAALAIGGALMGANAGCGDSHHTHGDASADAAKVENGCGGKDGCPGKDGCSGENGCGGKDGCSGDGCGAKDG